MNDIAHAGTTTHILASGIFTSGYTIAYACLGLIALISLVMGSAKTIGKQSKEGSGAGITHQIGTIFLAALIFLSCAGAAGIIYVFQSNGFHQTVPVNNPFGNSNFGQ